MTALVVDLRDPYADPPLRPEGRVVVLCAADSMVPRAEVFMTLLSEPMVSAMICVAIGDGGQASMMDGVALTIPPSLRPDGEGRSAVLWAGDVYGLWWAPGGMPHSPDRLRPAVDDLVDALRVDEIFDRVLEATGGMVTPVASPAIRLVRGPAEPGVLAEPGAAAVRSLCVADGDASREFAGRVRNLDDHNDPGGPALTAPIAAVAAQARGRLARIDDLAGQIGTGWDLFGPERATAVIGTETAQVAGAVSVYQRGVDELLNRMDGHLEEGRPLIGEVVELGVPLPRQPRPRDISAALRQMVDGRLREGVALPVLVQELRIAAAFSEPQGVSAQLERARRATVPQAVLPPFPRWPLPLATLPVIILTCLLLVLSRAGVDGTSMGAVIGAVWFAAGWLLLARRPRAEGETGFGPSLVPALATYGAAAALGLTAGVTARSAGYAVELGYPMLVLTGLVLTVPASALLCWRAAAKRWSATLPLAELRRSVENLDDVMDSACRVEWQPMRRRQAVAALSGAMATAAEEVQCCLSRAGEQIFPAPSQRLHEDAEQMQAADPYELFSVIRGDLVELCREALEPAWSDSGSTGRAGHEEYARRLQRLLGEYRTHVSGRTLLSPFRKDGDTGSRDALMSRAWARSPHAREALAIQPGDEMLQLCGSHQLGYLRGAAEPATVRFAPERLRFLLERDATDRILADDPGIEWPGGSGLIGAVRLVPLRAESVRYGWEGEAQ